jgi:hypothetical protein
MIYYLLYRNYFTGGGKLLAFDYERPGALLRDFRSCKECGALQRADADGINE